MTLPGFVHPNAFFCRTPIARKSPVSKINRTTAVAAVPQTPPPRKWQCISSCGACCNIGDYDADVLDEMLKSEEDVRLYASMVGEDGWCRNFDSITRKCTIYETRPGFCRVTPENFKRLYDVNADDINEFSIDCCEYHIGEVYGEDSGEFERFQTIISAVANCDDTPIKSENDDLDGVIAPIGTRH